LRFAQAIDEQGSQAEVATAQRNHQRPLEVGANEAVYVEKERAIADEIDEQRHAQSLMIDGVVVTSEGEPQGLSLSLYEDKPGCFGEEAVARMNQVDMQRRECDRKRGHSAPPLGATVVKKRQRTGDRDHQAVAMIAECGAKTNALEEAAPPAAVQVNQVYLGNIKQEDMQDCDLKRKHSELAITAHHRGDECMEEEEETKTGQPSPDRRGDSSVDDNEPLLSSSAWGHWFATRAMSQDCEQSSDGPDETSSFLSSLSMLPPQPIPRRTANQQSAVEEEEETKQAFSLPLPVPEKKKKKPKTWPPVGETTLKRFRKFLRELSSEQSADLVIRHFLFLKCFHKWKHNESAGEDHRDQICRFLEFPGMDGKEQASAQFLFTAWYNFKYQRHVSQSAMMPSTGSRQRLWEYVVANFSKIKACVLQVEPSAKLFFQTMRVAPLIMDEVQSVQ
jgi:hypothetical protein